MNEEKKYPISETFTSWQGEGLFSGTRMFFVRFAGCNVGKPLKESIDLKNEESGFPIWQERCCSWDDREFLCDTDFRVKERLTAKEILDLVPQNVEHICLTGGEPLIHDLFWILDLANHLQKEIHIETSGTKLFPIGTPLYDQVWKTVSPKKNCLMEMVMRANEIKLLVDDKFDEQKAEALVSFANKDCIIWLSPINGIKDIDEENAIRCLKILERHPTWRMNNQNQKLWQVR